MPKPFITFSLGTSVEWLAGWLLILVVIFLFYPELYGKQFYKAEQAYLELKESGGAND